MKSDPKASSQEVLAGLVERVTFHNEENGFCVLRTRARGHREMVTVVGQAAAISAGEWITASGEWVNDRAHGQQFRARFLKTSAPTSIEGMHRQIGMPYSTHATARATFAHEMTDHPHELIELCLAHAEGRGNSVARVYNRSDALERRRQLMADWGKFLAG
jgi:hypothetical protein